jgi:hypothetical protein
MRLVGVCARRSASATLRDGRLLVLPSCPAAHDPSPCMQAHTQRPRASRDHRHPPSAHRRTPSTRLCRRSVAHDSTSARRTPRSLMRVRVAAWRRARLGVSSDRAAREEAVLLVRRRVGTAAYWQRQLSFVGGALERHSRDGAGAGAGVGAGAGAGAGDVGQWRRQLVREHTRCSWEELSTGRHAVWYMYLGEGGCGSGCGGGGGDGGRQCVCYGRQRRCDRSSGQHLSRHLRHAQLVACIIGAARCM